MSATTKRVTVINLLELYYTPELIAHYCCEKDLTINQEFSLINHIYDKDYLFIHPKYKTNKKKFRTDLTNYIDYFTNKEEYLENINDIKNYYEELNIPLDILHETNSLDYFFVKTRIDILFNHTSYKRIKFRTLLNSYGYKRRSQLFKTHIHDCMLFYHIKGYHDNTEIDLDTIDIDDMIIFKVMDY